MILCIHIYIHTYIHTYIHIYIQRQTDKTNTDNQIVVGVGMSAGLFVRGGGLLLLLLFFFFFLLLLLLLYVVILVFCGLSLSFTNADFFACLLLDHIL